MGRSGAKRPVPSGGAVEPEPPHPAGRPHEGGGPDPLDAPPRFDEPLVPRRRPYRGKRALDLAVVAAAAPAALVLGALAWLAVRATGRPATYRQARVGAGEQVVHLHKLRTMVPGTGRRFPEDNPLTPVGRVLKRLSLDELPQLLDVLRGDLSVVGPRPMFAFQAERLDRRQRQRHAVRPGLTGLSQVRGRNTLTWAERVELDLAYVDRQSLWLDLRILAATARAVTSGVGHDGHPPGDPFNADPDGTTPAGAAELARRRLPLPGRPGW